MQRWAMEQRGFWVHGVYTLADYLRVATEFTLAGHLNRIQCPTLICAAQDDPLSSTATAVHDGLTASKTLLQFTSADGAGDHCEMRNRALFNLRAFDWLEDSLSALRLSQGGGRVGRKPIPKGRGAPYLWRGPESIGPFLLPPAAAVRAGPEPRSRWSAPLDERP